MRVQGTVIDSVTNKPLPGATIELWYGTTKLDSFQANSEGSFLTTIMSYPDTIKVSHVGYNEYQGRPNTDGLPMTYVLTRDVKELENFSVTSFIKKNKNGALIAGGLLFLLLLASKKRR